MRFYLVALVLIASASAQEVRPDVHPKDVREIGKGGSAAVPQLTEFLKSPGTEVRVEAVKQLTEARALDALVLACKDDEPEVEIRATDGLVNFYLPGYVQTGLSGSLKRFGGGIKGKFTDTNNQVIDRFVTVRPDVIAALGALVRGDAQSTQARANAARALGILRGKAAVPDLVAALRTKDTDILYESLIAMQKIGDQSAGPKIAFLLRDLNPKVQIAAIETTGVLQNQDAAPELIDVLRRSQNASVRRAALGSLAMAPDPKSRATYQQYLNDKDEKLRAGAAEGFARLRDPADVALVEQAWKDEGKTATRVSLAFAMAMLGRTEISEFSPLQFLVNTLNSSAYKGVAEPFLIELARDNGVRKSVYTTLGAATKDEKIGLARVLAMSGDKESVPYLEKLSRDTDPDVAQGGLRALRNLQARL
jgi:HEAT repeat protein